MLVAVAAVVVVVVALVVTDTKNRAKWMTMFVTRCSLGLNVDYSLLFGAIRCFADSLLLMHRCRYRCRFFFFPQNSRPVRTMDG